MNYYKNKLKEKVDIIFNSKGLETLELNDSLFVGISDGLYEIVWSFNQDRIITLVKLDHIVGVQNGLYRVETPFGNSKTLYSSQIIEFKISEERDFKLNKILNIDDKPYICKKRIKMLTEQEKKVRKHKKELNSLRNKLSGYSLIWFESLSEKKKYDLLFEWKRYKYSNDITKPEVRYVNRRLFGKKIKEKVIDYPASLKHFIKSKIGRGKWAVRVSELRNSTIDILLKD